MLSGYFETNFKKQNKLLKKLYTHTRINAPTSTHAQGDTQTQLREGRGEKGREMKGKSSIYGLLYPTLYSP